MDTNINNTWWMLEVDLPYGSKYEKIFPTEKEALIEHMYLESEGLDVSQWSIKQIITKGENTNEPNRHH
jgi:hypothetical protein